MRFRRLLASLALLTLIAGHPLAAAPAAGPDCTRVVAAAADCCATSDMSSCVLQTRLRLIVPVA